MRTVVALVPIDDQGVRPLCGHPLLDFTVAAAREADAFADVLVLPGREGLLEALQDRSEDAFAVLSPTCPFLSADAIRRAWARLVDLSDGADSIRSVERCREHPAKMWRIEGDLLRPLLERPSRGTPWHSLPYQRLPEVWVETPALEIAWRRVLDGHPSSRSPERVAHFAVEGIEAFSLECPDDFDRAERLVERGEASLPRILEPTY
jgi:CMP-N,N'-diacetyllegionaminic acid synthase